MWQHDDPAAKNTAEAAAAAATSETAVAAAAAPALEGAHGRPLASVVGRATSGGGSARYAGDRSHEAPGDRASGGRGGRGRGRGPPALPMPLVTRRRPRGRRRCPHELSASRYATCHPVGKHSTTDKTPTTTTPLLAVVGATTLSIAFEGRILLPSTRSASSIPFALSRRSEPLRLSPPPPLPVTAAARRRLGGCGCSRR